MSHTSPFQESHHPSPRVAQYDVLMSGLTRKQAAELAGVSTQTILGWQKSGHLQRPYTVDAVLAAQQVANLGEVIPWWRSDRVRAGQRLRALREQAGLTQLQLSAQAGISHEALSNLELGKLVASAPTVRQLSQALGVAPERFVDTSPIGLEMLSTQEAGRRLDVPVGRIQYWLQQGVLPATKVSGRWRVPAIAVAELDRSGRLRGRSRRLDPRYRG
jgi:excisionase family DNA binding protein